MSSSDWLSVELRDVTHSPRFLSLSLFLQLSLSLSLSKNDREQNCQEVFKCEKQEKSEQ